MAKSFASDVAFESSASTTAETGREAFWYAGRWASRAMPPAPITTIGLGWETSLRADCSAFSINAPDARELLFSVGPLTGGGPSFFLIPHPNLHLPAAPR